MITRLPHDIIIQIYEFDSTYRVDVYKSIVSEVKKLNLDNIDYEIPTSTFYYSISSCIACMITVCFLIPTLLLTSVPMLIIIRVYKLNI